MSISFANPWLLTALAAVGVAAWRLLRRGRRAGIRFSAVSRLPVKAAGWRARVAAMTPYVLLLGLASFAVALARPRSPLAHETKSVDAIAIAMTVDVSGSMEALDLTPPGTKPSADTTRLAVVKKLFGEFVSRRPDDLIGLVTFGTYATGLCPLTADHNALLHVLKGAKTATASYDANGNVIGEVECNTAIGDGLATSLAQLKTSRLKSKIAILLSDGENNAGAVTPEEAATAAAKMGVKVYAIGVGTRARRTPCFATDIFGRQRIVYRDMAFDERQLKSIAETTGGAYYPVADRDGLVKALEEIDKLETTRIEADAYDRWDEHFAWFLIGGALLVLLSVSLSMASSRRMA